MLPSSPLHCRSFAMRLPTWEGHFNAYKANLGVSQEDKCHTTSETCRPALRLTVSRKRGQDLLSGSHSFPGSTLVVISSESQVERGCSKAKARDPGRERSLSGEVCVHVCLWGYTWTLGPRLQSVEDRGRPGEAGRKTNSQ